MTARLAIGVAAGIFVLTSTFAVSAVKPLQCPAGFELRSLVSPREGETVEFCSNPKTGLPEGAGRTLRKNGTLFEEFSYLQGKLHGSRRQYDESGKVVFVESTYDNGKLISRSATLAGLKRIIVYGNQEAEKKGSAWRMSVIDEHRIRYTMTAVFPYSLLARDRVGRRRDNLESGEMCAVIDLPDTDIRSVDVRYVDTDGDLITEFTIRREDCRKRVK